MPLNPLRPALCALLLAAPAAQAGNCTPSEEGPAPLRRAVAQVKYLPQTEAWSAQMGRDGLDVQYVLSLDQPRRAGGHCYWMVEVRAGGRLWKRFLVSPGGGAAVEERAEPPR